MNVLKTKSEIALGLLETAFKNQVRVSIAELDALAQKAGVSSRTMHRAASRFGVKEIHNGNTPGFWERKGES
jgi:hypothetical protein